MESVLIARIGARAPLQRCTEADKFKMQHRISGKMQRFARQHAVQAVATNISHIGNAQTTPDLSEQIQTKRITVNDNGSSSSNVSLELAQRLVATMPDATSGGRPWAIIAVLVGATLLASPEAAMALQIASIDAATSHVAHPIADLAEDTDFWANVLRYISYFFSVLLGTAYVAIKPLIELLKRPTTAVLVIAGVAVVYIFVSTTVGAMLGMNDIIEYSPSSIVTPAL